MDSVQIDGRTGAAASKGRILIVEDEPFIAETVRFALEKAGYDCILAADGEEGIHAARRERPELILLDVMLPKLNGLQVCRILKADRNLAAVPVVMVTARVQDRDYVQGKEAGASDYVTKPFELDELLTVVERHLPRRDG